MKALPKCAAAILWTIALAATAAELHRGLPSPEFLQRWQIVNFGMTSGEVHKLLGRPTSSENTNRGTGLRRDYWFFLPSTPPLVMFFVEYDGNGLVTSKAESPRPKE